MAITPALPGTAAQPRTCGPARVVVGVDGNDAGVAALRWAVGFARARHLPLVAVRAWELSQPRYGGRRHGTGRTPVVLVFDGAQMRAIARNVTRQAFAAAVGGIPADLDVTIETPAGEPAQVLTAAAGHDGDVLVVGTHHGIRWRHAGHGSVSAYCARHAIQPVIVVGDQNHPGRETGNSGR